MKVNGTERLRWTVLRLLWLRRFGLLMMGLVVLAAGVAGMVRADDAISDETRLKNRLAENADDVEAAFELGSYYFDRGQRAEAELQFRAALNSMPKHLRSRVALGAVLNELGESEAALAEFDRALEQEPRDVPAICARGQALYALRRYSEAVDEYQRALVIDPQSQAAYYNIGIAFADAGIFREAIREWERVVQIDPNTETARIAREGIDVLASMVTSP